MTNETLEETWEVFFVVTKCTKKNEKTETTLACNTCTSGDVLARLLFNVEFDPLTAVWVDGAGNELMLLQVTKTETLTRLEDDTGRTNELRNNNALSAVDYKRSLFGHHREVAHEDGLFFNFASRRVHETRTHEDRRGEGHVLLFAFLHRELGRRTKVFVFRIEFEFELKRFGEVLNRADVAERFRETRVKEPLE